MAKTRAPQAATDKPILRLKVTLRGTRPPVWRRLLVPGDMTLGDLHAAIQGAMGWENCHLHDFVTGGKKRFGDPTILEDVEDEDGTTVKAILRSKRARLSYTYDFGDDWRHEIELEDRQPADDGASYPLCIAGRRACPPEDCGGVWGYGEMLETLANPGHREDDEFSEMYVGAFGPNAFDLKEANTRLRPVSRRSRSLDSDLD